MSTVSLEAMFREVADKYWPGSADGLLCVFRCLSTCEFIQRWGWTLVVLAATEHRPRKRAEALAKLRGGVTEWGWPCMQAEAIAALDLLEQTCPADRS